jgi:lipopolysaccharide biosynthesis regulator YciM
LLALGRDYYCAGLLDRAERLFFEVIHHDDSEYARIAVRYLLEIYQQQKRWEIAIKQAKKISKWDNKIFKNIAHYHCELAQNLLNARGSQKEAIRLLELALKYDAQCVRANLIKGKLAIIGEKWEQAIAIYQAIKKQDPDYITETLEPLNQCYLQHQSGSMGLLSYLHETLSEHAQTPISLAIVKLIQEKDNDKALQFLTQQLQSKPSLPGLYQLVDLHLAQENCSMTDKSNLISLKDLIKKLMENKPVYRCLTCGFNSKILDWLCPACRNWSTIKPL